MSYQPDVEAAARARDLVTLGFASARAPSLNAPACTYHLRDVARAAHFLVVAHPAHFTVRRFADEVFVLRVLVSWYHAVFCCTSKAQLKVSLALCTSLPGLALC